MNMMNDSNAYLLMEPKSNELRCGGLSGISPASDQPSSTPSSSTTTTSQWLPSPSTSTTNHNHHHHHHQHQQHHQHHQHQQHQHQHHTNPATPTDPSFMSSDHHQQYHQKPLTIMTSPTISTSLQQRRYSYQSSPASPINAMMMMDISASSPTAVHHPTTSSSTSSTTCSPPPSHYWAPSSNPSSNNSNNNGNGNSSYYEHPQSSSVPVTPVQYHQSPFMQSPIVSTTRSHSIKRNKLRQSTYTRWTLEEDERLKQAVTMHGPHKWSLIASHVPNRTPMQCSTRWLGALNPNIHKGRWTEYEDNILKYSVLEYANVTDNQGRIQPIPWNRIAERIPNRTGIQCQARWTEALDPYVRKGKWGADEDQLLRTGVKDHGRCWIRIAETIPGRTQRQCRTRWMQLQCKHSKQQQQQQQQQQQSPSSRNGNVTGPTTTPSASTSSTSSSSSSTASSTQMNDLLPYSSPTSSVEEVASPSSTDDEHTLMTTGPSPLTANSSLPVGTNQNGYMDCSSQMMPNPAKGNQGFFVVDDFNAALLRQQHRHHGNHPSFQQQHQQNHHTSIPVTSPHPTSMNYQQPSIKQVYHASPIQTSPSDVYSYFTQLSSPTSVFPPSQQQHHRHHQQ